MRQIPETMRAVAIDKFGGVEALSIHDVPVPKVGPKEVLIRVDTAGVGVWDPFEREGGFAEMFEQTPRFPYVLGSDGAGTVVAAGPKVKNLKEGDKAYGFHLFNDEGGFYAEYAKVRAEDAAPIPQTLTTDQAGAMVVDAITALRGLDDTLRLKKGETVMIFGASGGIGHLAVQLAKRMGALVFAVASGSDGVALVRELGADAVVDGHKDDLTVAARDFAPNGFDAALLTAGGEAAEKALMWMRRGGRAAYPNGVEPVPVGRSGITVKGYDGTPDRHAIDKLNQLIESGPFKVHIARTFPLEQAAEAQRALDQHYVGKLALRLH